MINFFELSISLVTYKPNIQVLAKTLRCLHHSLLASATTAKLYIIDNSCNREWEAKVHNCLQENFSVTDKIVSEFIVSGGNIGYGRANNIAIQRANSMYHLVINPDVYAFENTICEAIHYMDQHLKTGLLVPAIFGEDEAQHYLCKMNPTLFMMFLRAFAPLSLKNIMASYLGKFEMRDKDYQQVINNVPFPSGCFMFFRTDILKQIHGFSDDFFMYFEDADIGRRLLKISNSAYVPRVKIIHKWAREARTNKQLKWIMIKSAFIYWRKWGGIA